MVSLHVEPTSRCTLACPRCERTVLLEKFGKKFLPIVDLDIDSFTKFIDVKVDHISLCGNRGDPIYHRNFLDLVKNIKTKCDQITITTNGSSKSQNWWQSLCEILDDNDIIRFSIDGLPENFTKYRINANWESIKVGIKCCVKNNIYTEWKFIPFGFNEDKIDSARDLANQLGVDKFYVDPSDRWEKDDWLRPTRQNFIGVRDTVQQNYKYKDQKNYDIDPKCKNQTHHYISADGYYTPCCYSKHYEFYYKSNWYKDKNKHDIKNTKLSKQLDYFAEFYSKINTIRPDYCVFNCGIAND